MLKIIGLIIAVIGAVGVYGARLINGIIFENTEGNEEILQKRIIAIKSIGFAVVIVGGFLAVLS